MLTGGCLCGEIRYEAGGAPFSRGFCHCVTCRRAAGAPVVAWFSVRPAELRVIKGEPKSFRSSEVGVRQFCGGCGSQLFMDDARYPDEIDIAIASLDEPEAVAPEFHIFNRSRLPWLKIEDGLPTYDTGR